ncbi:MAG: AlwI family type II restriction endonuclease [Treponema sp.]|nr:AlwI family type II restriction endonuclease [Treponema sp.]
MTDEEFEDEFYNIWSGSIRTFDLQSTEYSSSNIDFEKSWQEKYSGAPLKLGFVDETPMHKLTAAGKNLVTAKCKEEVFLRQMLKFQIPSPYHKPTKNAAKFWVKPYLEIFRLVRQLGTLRFDEMRLFGLQLTDYRKFDEIVEKINQFRIAKTKNTGSYKQFYGEYAERELKEIYKDEIKNGDTKTRETADASLKKFLRTKFDNMRDYTDACFRYLRATGMVNISHVGKSVSIASEKLDEVDYFLANIDREPCYVNDTARYEDYLCDIAFPTLLTDNRALLIKKIRTEFPQAQFEENAPTEALKDMLDLNTRLRKEQIITEQVRDLKDYKLYDDIQNTFKQIVDDDLYDAPLMLEWNTWRAMTMLDGGMIKANLKFDDFGKPMSSAQGNMADIVCDYDDFGVTVEVTTASGQKQYEMESEPVSRHLGKFKKAENKNAYCLFVAPTINEACIAYFFMLHKTNIAYYGGKSVIVPLPLSVFQKMLEDSYRASYTPNSEQVRKFFEYSKELAESSADEVEWYKKVTEKALNWLD